MRHQEKKASVLRSIPYGVPGLFQISFRENIVAVLFGIAAVIYPKVHFPEELSNRAAVFLIPFRIANIHGHMVHDMLRDFIR